MINRGDFTNPATEDNCDDTFRNSFKMFLPYALTLLRYTSFTPVKGDVFRNGILQRIAQYNN